MVIAEGQLVDAEAINNMGCGRPRRPVQVDLQSPLPYSSHLSRKDKAAGESIVGNWDSPTYCNQHLTIPTPTMARLRCC